MSKIKLCVFFFLGWLFLSQSYAQSGKILAGIKQQSQEILQEIPPLRTEKYGISFQALFDNRNFSKLETALDTTDADYVFIHEEFSLKDYSYSLTHKYFFLSDSLNTDYCGNVLPLFFRYRIRQDTLERGGLVFEPWKVIEYSHKIRSRIPFIRKKIKSSMLLSYFADGSELPTLTKVIEYFDSQKHKGSQAHIPNYFGGCLIRFDGNSRLAAKSEALVDIPSVRVRSLIDLRSGTVKVKLEYPEAQRSIVHDIYVGMMGPSCD